MPTPEICNNCDHKLYYPDLGRCDYCGFTNLNGRMAAVCKKCDEETDKLYGFFVPHLCKQCNEEVVKEQQLAGKVCRLCGHVYLYCAC